MYDIQDYKELAKNFEGMDVGILILSAGVFSIGKWEDISGEDLDKQMNVNCLHPMYLTKVMLPHMLARQ